MLAYLQQFANLNHLAEVKVHTGQHDISVLCQMLVRIHSVLFIFVLSFRCEFFLLSGCI